MPSIAAVGSIHVTAYIEELGHRQKAEPSCLCTPECSGPMIWPVDGPAAILVTKWPCALSMARPHSSVGVQFAWPSAGFLLPRLSPA